ncbi:MAG: hypothetical protein O7G87_21635, partial [bacterium]|nr:hypothetical protein [bacterium]
AACDALFEGKDPEIDVVEEDEDIDVGERMVRRLVFQHVNLNPTQDLPASLALLSVVHDVERIGDYAKSLVYLARWRTEETETGEHGVLCGEIREAIAPMVGQTLKALREGDAELAREVMRKSREVKNMTRVLLESLLQDGGEGREAVVCSSAAQYLRRISAHLSNIASSVANPFDQLAGDEA